MTPLRHPAPDCTTGAKLADTDIHADMALAARSEATVSDGAAFRVQPFAAVSESKMKAVTAVAGGQR